MNNIIHFENISYGEHERQRVDVFIPEKPGNKSGFVLFIHGGGWCAGDKDAHYDDACYFCKQGFVAASMNYRFVSDDISVYDELDDIYDALSSIKRKCSEYGIHSEKVILSGVSAGAHLSMLYAYSRKTDAPVTPVAVCAYCPPVNCYASDFLYGITEEFDEWKYGILSKCCNAKITGKTHPEPISQKALKKISPCYYVDSACVPTAVFHGRKDDLVPVLHITDFMDALKRSGVKNDLLIYENSGHDLDKDPEIKNQSREIIGSYLSKYLK